MTLGALITKALTDHEIGLQFLSANVTNATQKKNGDTKLTFVTRDTNPGHILRDDGPIGIVLWIPRGVYDELSKL